MEYLKHLLLSCTIFVLFLSGIQGLTPTIFATKEGILGPSDLQLKCVYTPASGDTVLDISVEAEISSSYIQIASLIPPGQSGDAQLTDAGNTLLENRVTLTNPSSTSSTGQYEAVITYNETTCEDEKRYRCQVAYRSAGGVFSTQQSQPASIVVKGRPSIPDSPPTWTPSSGIEEGMTVNFTCTGNVGKPAGKFVWIKYKESTPYPQGDVTTTAQQIPGTCTSNGTSVLSVQVQAEDNNAVFRCQVEQELADNTIMYTQTQPNDFNVYYKVRNIKVTKSPDHPNYAEGTEAITLTCSAEGNPPLAPKDYTWYNETDMDTPLGTGATYTIQDVRVNRTGNYVCVAQNIINGKQFNISSTVHIQIDFTTTPAPTTTPSVTSDAGVSKAPQDGTGGDEGMSIGAIIGIVVGCIAAIVVIVIVIICVLKPCRDKDPDSSGHSGSSTGKPINNMNSLEKSAYDNKNDYDKNGPFNNQIHYADLQFDYDDRPRSRKPINLSQDTDLNSTPYAEVMMPRV